MTANETPRVFNPFAVDTILEVLHTSKGTLSRYAGSSNYDDIAAWEQRVVAFLQTAPLTRKLSWREAIDLFDGVDPERGRCQCRCGCLKPFGELDCMHEERFGRQGAICDACLDHTPCSCCVYHYGIVLEDGTEVVLI